MIVQGKGEEKEAGKGRRKKWGEEKAGKGRRKRRVLVHGIM